MHDAPSLIPRTGIQTVGAQDNQIAAVQTQGYIRKCPKGRGGFIPWENAQLVALVPLPTPTLPRAEKEPETTEARGEREKRWACCGVARDQGAELVRTLLGLVARLGR